jgi:mono/diheme cytochrome c family protein
MARVSGRSDGTRIGHGAKGLYMTYAWRCLYMLWLLVVLSAHGGEVPATRALKASSGTHLPSYAAGSMSAGLQDLQVQETFERQCSSCHGAAGRGDGRVARMLKPRPPGFQGPEGVSRLSDEELLSVIANGRGSMPAYQSVLGDDVLTALVAYVRLLGRGAKP